jgi:hypothetical protein
MYPYQTYRRGAKTAFSNTLTALMTITPKWCIIGIAVGTAHAKIQTEVSK